MHWFDVMLWAMWFSMTLGTGLILWYRERQFEKSSHNPEKCGVCKEFRAQAHFQHEMRLTPEQRRALIKVVR